MCICDAQGWEDVTHLKDEMVTQQKKMDQLKAELTDLEQAENSLKVWAVDHDFTAIRSKEEAAVCFLLPQSLLFWPCRMTW